jgi:hypothetical protein
VSAPKKKLTGAAASPPVTTNFDLAPRPLPAPWHVERLLHGSVRLVANKEPGDEGFGDDVGFNCSLLDAHRVAALEFAARAVNSHAALVAAVRAAAAWISDPDANPIEEYERIAAEYQRDTGRLRPGKSAPIETGRESSSEENRQRFHEWCRERSRKVLAELRAAIALAEGA